MTEEQKIEALQRILQGANVAQVNLGDGYQTFNMGRDGKWQLETTPDVKVVDAEVVEDDGKVDTPSIPKSMNGKGVTSFFEKLKRDGILDENLQPKVSNRNASILADYVGSKFKIRTKWKDFAELWGMDKEVLRSTFNNITNNDEDKAFCKRLAKL
ncbi:MAG: hypothetical protein Q4D33_12235 [Prevotellaceae bacterium]|nr:hypothetical protein [Prevotellaceae bacterium]